MIDFSMKTLLKNEDLEQIPRICPNPSKSLIFKGKPFSKIRIWNRSREFCPKPSK
jgi:hypothetical protein